MQESLSENKPIRFEAEIDLSEEELEDAESLFEAVQAAIGYNVRVLTVDEEY